MMGIGPKLRCPRHGGVTPAPGTTSRSIDSTVSREFPGSEAVAPRERAHAPGASGIFHGGDNRVVAGRELVASDSAETITPIVIGSDVAAMAFGNANPVGRRVATLGRDQQRVGELEIVGVVSADDAGSSNTGTSIRIYTPMGGPLAVPGPGPDALLIRTVNPAEFLIPTFREIVRAEAPMVPIYSMKTLARIERESRAEIIEAAGASAFGGLMTLFLASIGLYAVVSLAVSQRQREIGVRLSLGARPGQVVAMFFRSGLRVSLLGLLAGLPLSVVAMQVVTSQMGVPRTNVPLVANAVAVSVVAVASLASWLPARRAAGADPLVALRDT